MTISFNGHNFETLFTVGDQMTKHLAANPATIDVPGRDGEVVNGVDLGECTVSFKLTAIGNAATCRSSLSTLAGWLDVDEPKALVLPDNAWSYLAVPKGTIDVSRGIGGQMFAVTFAIVDPAAYGETKTATVPSGDSVSITVNGPYPTAPTIAASAAVRDSTSLTWGIQVDGGDYIHVATGSSSSRAVAIDCGKRTCTVASVATMPTLDSDWLTLAPGTHTVSMYKGTGAATLTWVERWL